MTTRPLPPFTNPFRPGAGHTPPYLAGRTQEQAEFRRLLAQDVILENMVLTGLRGVGKTVLLESLKPQAMEDGWLWVGTDLSESASVSELILANRVITDLAVVTGNIFLGSERQAAFGFMREDEKIDVTLGYATLSAIFERTPGLVSDKLKAVLLSVAPHIQKLGKKGIVFAYDESQNLADHAEENQYPLSLLLEVFQFLQRQNIPFMLLLTGLPTLFQKLIEARTYAERMFRVIVLRRLNDQESRDAISKPIADARCPVHFRPIMVDLIVQYSGGYPYFIQFMCREIYDTWLQQTAAGQEPIAPITEIMRKLDNDFFAGRWARVTDRQQHLLYLIAQLDTATEEFTIQEILAKSQETGSSFGRSQINQMLTSLITSGIVYKDRHGKYLFAVPLMADFIKRTMGN